MSPTVSHCSDPTKRIHVRVIHITEAFGGGLRTAIVNYINATPQIDHTLFARTREDHATTEIPSNSHLEPYEGGLVGFYWHALRTVMRNDYDIVHLHSSFAGALRAFLPPSTRIVYSPHCYAMEDPRSTLRTAAYWTIERVLAQRPQLLTAVSPREIELGNRLSKRMPTRFVPNAAPTSPTASQSVSTTNGAPYEPSRPVIAMLGRICSQKDPEYFAEVTALVGDRYRFLWIGDGDEGRAALEAAGVEITGWVTLDRAHQLLASSALYVHTAAWEGGPLATLEAADAGCPVICRDIPSMRSLGYELAGKTPHQTAAAIHRYFADPEYRSAVEIAGKTLLSTYSTERMASDLIAAYSFALDAFGTPSLARQPRG